MNTLYYGDNLPILRKYFSDASVDLIYLDPPFNSNRSYNVLFREESGSEAQAQITAFDDTWHWTAETEKLYHEIVAASLPVSGLLSALRFGIGANQMMAYLVMMTARLIELHRVLKPTGSLYLHCDPTASHYLKIILDAIFGAQNFRNEIVWKRTSAHSNARRFGSSHDVLLYYSRCDSYKWNEVYLSHDDKYIESHYSLVDSDGRRFMASDLGGHKGVNKEFEWMGMKKPWRYPKEKLDELNISGRIYWTNKGTPRYKRYLDELPGSKTQDIWIDVPPINSQAAERLGYPTQKPVALLERIIQASSNPGDIVLDPFCGCGTAVVAAQKLGRQWMGIDVTHLSIALMKYRLKDAFNLDAGRDYAVIGEPQDMASARQLALDDRYQFQWWALSLIKARPLGDRKKGADRGIDGIINFIDDNSGKAKLALVQVKSGHVTAGHIRDLVGVLDRESAAIGIYITLEEPTREMRREAVTAGFYHSDGWNRDYPRIQILTIADLLQGAEVKLPPSVNTFRKASANSTADQQAGLF